MGCGAAQFLHQVHLENESDIKIQT